VISSGPRVAIPLPVASCIVNTVYWITRASEQLLNSWKGLLNERAHELKIEEQLRPALRDAGLASTVK
jgi:hypothetical protein